MDPPADPLSLRSRLLRMAGSSSGRPVGVLLPPAEGVPVPPVPRAPVAAARRPEVAGEWAEGPCGRSWVRRTVFPAGVAHAGRRLDALRDLDPSPLRPLTGCPLDGFALPGALFLDVETTGPGSGAGFRIFLAGFAWLGAQGEVVTEQHFLRDPIEERAMMGAVAERVRTASLIVTYSGKTFDRHCIEDRCRMLGIRPPFGGIPHLDLLHAARALWPSHPAGHALQEIERTFLSHYRVGDLPGSECPRAYLEYLTGQTLRVERVFDHNRDDLLALPALLLTLADRAARPRDAGEALALGRASARRGLHAEALGWARQAVALGAPDPWGREAARLAARTAKRLGLWDEAARAFGLLAASPGLGAYEAAIELSKLKEHRTREIGEALAAALRARSLLFDPFPPFRGDRLASVRSETERRIDRLRGRAAERRTS